MAVATEPAYKTEIEEVYANYKRMEENAVAPDFNYMNIDGQSVTLKELRGKYVYIDIWATWCAPCRAEVPFLKQLEQAYEGKNIYFVSISIDKIANKDKWMSYVKEHHLSGMQLIADKDFNSDFVMKFNVNSIPRFILIDPSGRIISGDANKPSNPELRQQLDVLLR
jgi:thiol-disulfide isomerase/thioredoxin